MGKLHCPKDFRICAAAFISGHIINKYEKEVPSVAMWAHLTTT